MGRLFMDALDDPFAAARRDRWRSIRSGAASTRSSSISTPRRPARRWRSAISPTAASRRCSAPTRHVPTADAQILPGGTAYHDRCRHVRRLRFGDRHAEGSRRSRRFVTKMPGERPQVAEGEATLCGVFVETDDATGLARRIEPVRIGGRLTPHWPAEFATIASPVRRASRQAWESSPGERVRRRNPAILAC